MINLQNITLRRGSKVLLDKASATFQPGENVGLVGRNGAGKSTLFALLNGTLHEDGGDLQMPGHWQMAQVAQNMPETDESATDFVLDGDTRLATLKQALKVAEDSEDGMAIAHAYTDLADAGVYDAEPRAQALILGLGFRPDQLLQPVNSFSGGWRMRLQLARALMCPSDLLLLDEPTNHLDLDALVWLESWLKTYAGTMVVISHDREFLDAVTNVTVHIDHARLTRYGGNYSAFETLRAQQLALQQSAFSKQQDKVAHLQKFISRFKAQASKAKQAQSRVKALERMEKIAPVLADADFTFEFRTPGNIPNPMLSITDADFGYPGEDGAPPTTILTKVSKSVLAGQRIGILGANGQGKSTFIKTVAKDLGAIAGTITEGKGLRIGYFAQQELDVLRPDDNPLVHMIRLARELGADAKEPSREQDLRSYLGTFNFTGEMVLQPVGTMSGGEKARLVLAMMVWQRPNLLLLDEPTNHLDLATREALAMALNGFEGTLMLVSHDRALLRSVCEEFWMVGRGKVTPFEGDLDDYQRYLLDEAKRMREEAKAAAAAPAAKVVAAPPPASAAPVLSKSQKAGQLKPLQKELATNEARMAEIDAEKATLETRLQQSLPAGVIAEAGRKLKALTEEAGKLEERWLELTGRIEAIGA